jgi:site-specific recombinase XerC
MGDYPTRGQRSGDPYKPVVIRDYDRIMRVRLFPALGHLRLTGVRAKDVQAFVDRLVADGVASATVDSAVTPLRAFYRRAVARGDAQVNPTVGIEKPAVRCGTRTVVSPVDAERMIAALDGADRVL